MEYAYEQITQINNSISIVEYASQYLELRQGVGRRSNEYWTPCCFHGGDINPSLSFNSEKNVYKCMGCDSKGYLINFIMQYHKLSFPKAVEHVLQLVDIDIEEKEPSKIMDFLYKSNIKKDPRDNLNRIYLPENIMNQYTNKPIKEWLTEGMSQEILDKYEVRYDEKSNAIVFPIKDVEHKILAIKARTLYQNYQDLGIAKYIYYNSIGTNDFLFGLNQNMKNIKLKNEVIVVEAEKGVMILDSFGFDNVVSISTKIMTQKQVELLLSLKCNIIFAFDKDVAEKELYKIITPFSLFTNVQYVYDKDNLLKSKDSPYDKGIEIWQNLFNNYKYKIRE